MKRTELLKKLDEIAKAKNLALEFVRHGGNHDFYRIGSHVVIIARHREIPEQTARGTLRGAKNA